MLRKRVYKVFLRPFVLLNKSQLNRRKIRVNSPELVVYESLWSRRNSYSLHFPLLSLCWIKKYTDAQKQTLFFFYLVELLLFCPKEKYLFVSQIDIRMETFKKYRSIDRSYYFILIVRKIRKIHPLPSITVIENVHGALWNTRVGGRNDRNAHIMPRWLDSIRWVE